MHTIESAREYLSSSGIKYNIDEVAKVVRADTPKGKVMFFLTKDKWQLGNKNIKGSLEDFVAWLKKHTTLK